MADRLPDTNPSVDSLRMIVADWNIAGSAEELEPASRPDPRSFWNIPGEAEPGSSSRPVVDVERGSVPSTALYAGLASNEPPKNWNASHDDSHELAHQPRRLRSKPVYPRPGDELAGFRVLFELGRGAFAHVYLAQEISLGQRLVAIKVSQPDGNEPQALARLQHTHIVPVYSVRQDPSSGLRVLCMPYFGGANLAQVLEAAGGLVTAHHAGRSLVEALDQISRSLPALPTSESGLGPLQYLRSQPAVVMEPPARSTTAVARVQTAGSRFSWLVHAGTAPPPARARLDSDQPSRRFLQCASAIQAAVWIVTRLAEGLDHAHSRGLLHRDLKPSNILLAADGTPMLLDFNLAVERHPDPGARLGEVKRALIGGTLPYMSPEHLDAFDPHGTTSPGEVDERSDIYALGLILFEMIGGEHPFPSPPAGTPVLEAIGLMIASRERVPSLRARCPRVPWSLDALVAKCLDLDPARRYSRAGDLAEDLRRFLEHRPMKHCPEPSLIERLGKFAKRHPGLCGSTSIALFSLALLSFMAGTIFLVHDKMQQFAARVRIGVFDREFAECQFLLHTASGSREHLKQGIDKARQTIENLGIESGGRASFTDWEHRLSPGEIKRLREQVVELIMLDASADVLLASGRGQEAGRRQAIERAIARLDRAERIDAQAPSALYAERARYHAALGQARLADQDRRRAVQTIRSTCHDLTLRGTTLLADGDRPGAEEALKHALRLDVTSFWAWFMLGHCHYAQGRFLEAAGDFAACAARGPTFAWTHFNRGLSLAKGGRPLDARYAYDRAIELDPTFAEARVDRALVELELNQLEDARDDLTRAIELGRNDLVVLAALGETWSRMGRRSEAEQYFARLLTQNPADLMVRVARGVARVRTDPDGARGDFAWVLEKNRGHALANYGMALLVRGTDLGQALEYLNQALETDPNLIDAVQLRALVRARLGDPAALDDIERLVESPTAHRLYNAACAVAVFSKKAPDRRLPAHALELLARAIKAGFPTAGVASDPDLIPLHALPEFTRLLSPKT
jgi:serine/threonine protein kinase/Tfp pilus assembly protein PilF